MPFKNISIKNKLVLNSVMPILGVAFLMVFLLDSLSKAEEGVTRIYEKRVIPLEILKTISDNYAVNVVNAVNKANAGEMTGPEALKSVRSARVIIKDKWAEYTAVRLSDQERLLSKDALVLFEEANAALDKLESLLERISRNVIVAGMLDIYDGQLYKSIDPISSKIDELILLQLKEAERERKLIKENYEQQTYITVLIVLVIVLALVVQGTLIYRSIKLPIENLKEGMSRVANLSDLTTGIKAEGTDEVSQMADFFNTMITRQRDLITGISQAVGLLTEEAKSMSNLSDASKEGITGQQVEIQQVASAMHQMLSNSNEVLENAMNADERTQAMQNQAEEGNLIVSEAVLSTQTLIGNVKGIANKIISVEEHSHNIGSVVEVINEIAEQTNLLALNAAIEAARAGDQGRGFAVVADEVRTLALRTQQSTTEIAVAIQNLQQGTGSAVTTMENSQAEAGDAGIKAKEAGGALQEIETSVREITQMNRVIAKSSREQSQMCGEINRSLQAISDVSSISAQNSSEISMSSKRLEELSTDLALKISKFKV